MNETNEGNSAAAGARPHIIAAVFAFPAIVCWSLARVFVFSVLVCAWQKMSPPYTQWSWVMDATRVLFSAVLVPVVLAPLILMLLERYIAAWLRPRQMVIATALWCVNAVVLLAIGCLCLGLAILASMQIS